MSEWKLVPVEPTDEMLKHFFGPMLIKKMEYEAFLKSLPTPEVEPVYQHRVLGIEQRNNSGPLWKDATKERYESFLEQEHPCRIVYPAPTDELVKAAVEIIKIWDGEGRSDMYGRVIDSLRAALDKVK